MCDRGGEIRAEIVELKEHDKRRAQNGVQRVGAAVVNVQIHLPLTSLITKVCVENGLFNFNQARPKNERLWEIKVTRAELHCCVW